MSRIYVITKSSNVYSDGMDLLLLNHYFDAKEDAQEFLANLGDEEFGEGTFYKVISDDGEIRRKWSDYTEGIYFTMGGKKCSVEYRINTLRSYKKDV